MKYTLSSALLSSDQQPSCSQSWSNRCHLNPSIQPVIFIQQLFRQWLTPSIINSITPPIHITYLNSTFRAFMLQIIDIRSLYCSSLFRDDRHSTRVVWCSCSIALAWLLQSFAHSTQCVPSWNHGCSMEVWSWETRLWAMSVQGLVVETREVTSRSSSREASKDSISVDKQTMMKVKESHY